MAGRGIFVVEGGDRLIRTLEEASVDVRRLKDTNREAATIAATAASSGAPRGKTGNLARSVRVGATQKAGIVRVGNNTSVPYANPIHWGWPKRHIKANPWASEAAQATEPAWHAVYDHNVSELLNEVRGV